MGEIEYSPPREAPAIRWDDRLRIGEAEVDGQHKQLVASCNELLAAVRLGRGQAAVAATLTRLRDYTLSHFAAEERLMERVGYPGLDRHRAVHADMARRVKEYQRQIYQHQDPTPAEVCAFLKDWLIGHILGQDLKIAAFLKSRAAAQPQAPEPSA